MAAAKRLSVTFGVIYRDFSYSVPCYIDTATFRINVNKPTASRVIYKYRRSFTLKKVLVTNISYVEPLGGNGIRNQILHLFD